MSAAVSPDSGVRDAKPLGGFFELHEPDDRRTGPSVLETWVGKRPYAGFVNARSAMAALVDLFPQATIWAPAFVCREFIHSAHLARTRFYPVKEGFSPDLGVLEMLPKPGDLVVFCAYFGLPVGEEVRAFMARRSDLLFVEDRAQALDVEAEEKPPEGRRWVLYSPRKLLGVADGGVLVAHTDAAPLPVPQQKANMSAVWRAPILRHKDPGGRNNGVWHAANSLKERRMAVTQQAMTVRSLSILSRTSLHSLGTPRLRNWAALERRLGRWSALPSHPVSPPLGYVLRLEAGVRDRLLHRLHEARIFACVHWPAIAAPAERFDREARWTKELLTLPCDHRYDEADMDRVATCVLKELR